MRTASGSRSTARRCFDGSLSPASPTRTPRPVISQRWRSRLGHRCRPAVGCCCRRQFSSLSRSPRSRCGRAARRRPRCLPIRQAHCSCCRHRETGWCCPTPRFSQEHPHRLGWFTQWSWAGPTAMGSPTSLASRIHSIAPGALPPTHGPKSTPPPGRCW